MEGLARQISAETGVTISIAPAAGYPAVINDEALYRETLRRVPDIRELENRFSLPRTSRSIRKRFPACSYSSVPAPELRSIPTDLILMSPF